MDPQQHLAVPGFQLSLRSALRLQTQNQSVVIVRIAALQYRENDVRPYRYGLKPLPQLL